MISRRHLRFTIALLLPLMVLRTMLPTGYMPVVEQGAMRIVMCSAGVLLPGVVNHDGTNKHPAPEHSGDAGDCQFAHSAVGAPPVQHAVATAHRPAEFRALTASADELPTATGPPRTAAARAPPAFS